MIYIFDKKQIIIKVLTNEDLTAGHLDFKLNTATTFEFSLPTNKVLPTGAKYVAVSHPLDDKKFVMFRLTERVDNADTVDYSAYELAYQELQSYSYISDKRPKDADALTLMKTALSGTNWELNTVNVAGKASTSFYYVDHLTAISNVVDLLGGEIVFYVEMQGNTISGRYMDYLARQGEDTSKVFAKGSNLLTVERQTDTSGVYTAILPRGKGVQVSGQDNEETPDGYGRRLNIADVEWKKSDGRPLDKAKGSLILGDPDANAEWGHIDGQYRLLIQNYDDIDNVNVLINSAYKTLKSVNHPQIQYSATVADVGGLALGDTVLIMHGQRNLSYKTRVFEVKYDLLDPKQTEISLGDDLTENSIVSQVITLGSSQNTLSEQTQWTVAQVGREPLYFGSDYPEHPKVGDIFFKYLPNGDTVVYRWNGTIWEELVSTNTAEEISDAVDDAIKTATSYADSLNATQASEAAEFQAGANAALSSAASERESLAAEADSIASSAAHQLQLANSERAVFSSAATSMANSAASRANSLANSAAAYGKAQATSALSSANDALAIAKQELGSEVSKAQSDIVATNTELSGKVSQTDYDKKTQELSTQYGQVKTTADAVTTEVAKYKETNDRKVNANTASITTLNNEIDSKVSQTDYDKKTQELSGNYSEIKQTVGSISNVVTELQTKANAQGQVNQLMNTEFNPDLEGWEVSGTKPPYKSYVPPKVGSTSIGFWTIDAATNTYHRLWQTLPIPTISVKKISLSWRADVVEKANYNHLFVKFTDKDGKDVFNNSNNQAVMVDWDNTSYANSVVKLEGVDVPDTATSVTIDFEAREGTKAYMSQPMLVFDDHIGDYVPGNYNNNNRVAALEVSLDGITGLVTDPKNGLSATATLAANGMTVAANAQSAASTAIQKADGIQTTVESMQSTNQFTNTEFNPDLAGWIATSTDKKNNPYRSYLDKTVKATTVGFYTLNADTSSGNYFAQLKQTVPLGTAGSGYLSLSWQSYLTEMADGVYGHLWVIFHDASGNVVYNSTGANVMGNWIKAGQTNWSRKKLENIEIPNAATTVDVSFEVREGIRAYLARPMLVFDSHIGDVYIAGSYNNNDTMQSIRTQLADQITDEVEDRKTGDKSTVTQLEKTIDQRITANNGDLETRFTQTDKSIEAEVKARSEADTSTYTRTAQYVDSTVKKASEDLQSSIDQTAGSVTVEIQDRKNGDDNTLLLSKQYTVSQIKDANDGFQSAIEQSASGIMASVSMPNKLLNTEFNPDLENWNTSITGDSQVPYLASQFKGSGSVGFYTLNAAASSWSKLQQYVTVPAGNYSVSLLWWVQTKQNDNNTNVNVQFLDASDKQISISAVSWADPDKQDKFVQRKWENIQVPTGAIKLRVSFEAREGTQQYLAKPMLVFSSSVDMYMAGSYSGINTSTVLELFKDNWALGIADNSGKLISGINGDTSGTVIQGKKLVINSDTTINGKAFIDGSVIKNASIGQAQIGNAAIGSAQIINVDVSKISGNIANFITANVDTLNARVLYGDTGHLGTTDTGRIINKQDNHLQLAAKGFYDSTNDRAQLELLGNSDNSISDDMKGSLNYYGNPTDKGHGLGIRLKYNQILAIDEDGGSKNLYLSPYAGGQVRIVSRDLNSYYDIAAANFRVSSQRKFKSDIKPLDDGALDIVNKTNIKSYTKNGVSEIGVIADEAPNELLSDDGKFINIYDYTSVLYKAVQELSAQVKELQDERSNN